MAEYAQQVYVYLYRSGNKVTQIVILRYNTLPGYEMVIKLMTE
jgi:hypothetical protein